MNSIRIPEDGDARITCYWPFHRAVTLLGEDQPCQESAVRYFAEGVARFGRCAGHSPRETEGTIREITYEQFLVDVVLRI